MSRYVNWQEIGRGGHATVYRVHDVLLGRDVAMKVLNERAAGDADLIAGLRREVLISRDLRHRRICPIHDIYEGETLEGQPGIGVVMDLINGSDAKQWIKVNRGKLSVTAQDRLTFLIRVTEALDFAHRLIVHRDLKPANVFLFQGDITDPVIMDFGISVVGGATAGIGGTPVYMAPEQWESPAKVDGPL